MALLALQNSAARKLARSPAATVTAVPARPRPRRAGLGDHSPSCAFIPAMKVSSSAALRFFMYSAASAPAV